MRIKYLLSISLLLCLLHCDVQLTQAADCDGYRFLCEHSELFISDSVNLMPIRMPLTSSNCSLNGAAANCVSTIRAKKGKKLLVKTGITFELGKISSPCSDDRHVRFESADDTITTVVRRCGVHLPSSILFESVSEEMKVEYRSDSDSDGAVIDVTDFGCSLEEEDIPNLNATVEVFATTFGPKDSEYEGMVTCREGYQMEGGIDKKKTLCKSSPVPSSTRTSWRWEVPVEDFMCNRITCGEQISPANSTTIRLSNGLYYGSEATFECAKGYTLVSNGTLICGAKMGKGGYWEGSRPYCKVIECDKPNIEGANYTEPLPAAMTYQTRISYSCSEGTMPSYAEATCTANATWDYTQCEAITCSKPVVISDWRRLSTNLSSTFHLGLSISVVCDVNGSIISAIKCELSSNNSSSAVWTSLPECKRPPSPPQPPIERIQNPGKSNVGESVGDKAGVIGGVVAGLLFAVIVIVIACIFVKKSSAKKKAARNNNEKAKLTKLGEPQPEERQQRLRSLKIEEIKLQPESDNEQNVPQIISHYRNRGNHKLRNGIDSGNSTIGTVSSHKSSDSEASVGLLETGDLYDSVINGGKANSTSHNSTDNEGSESAGSESAGSALSRVENELNESQFNGTMGPNKKTGSNSCKAASFF